MGGVDWVPRLCVLLLRRRVNIKARRCRGKMKRSPIFPRDENGGCNELGYDPIFPRDENGGCNELGYDPRDDFSKFLEEARKHTNEARFEPELLSNSSPKKRNMEAKGRKDRRSWKNCLFFWWRFEKGTPLRCSLAGGAIKKGDGATQVSKPRRGAVSGPMAIPKQHICRPRRAASGPLSGCFTPSRVDEEAEMPYMRLDQFNTPSRSQAFGPIYLVT